MGRVAREMVEQAGLYDLVDLVHKTVYAVATGVVADALAARSGPGPGRQHAALRPGRHADVGPLPREHAHAR